MPQGILPIDTEGVLTLWKSTYNVMRKAQSDAGVPDALGVPVSGFVACVGILPVAIIAVTAHVVTRIGGFIAVQFLGVIDELKKSNAADFNNVIAASANELLGTSLSGSQLTGGSGGGSSMDQNEQLGNALLGVFESGLGGLQPVTPEQGAQNARKFAGFAINFAMNQGFLSILTEATSLGFLKEFHELPEGLKGALGLGRLQRAALAPLVRNAISQPYDLYLKYLMRPDRLAEGQIVRALKAGQLDDPTARQMLAEKGYRDSDIELLIQDLAAKIAASELFTLVRYGDITLDQAIAKLTDAGMDADDAKLQFKALSEAKADTQVGSTLADLEAARVDGFIKQEEFSASVDDLPLSDDENSAFRKRVANKIERPRKRVTLAQVQTAVVNAIADFSYLDDWMSAEGYDDQSQLILTFETLEKLKTAADKETYKQYKAAVLRKAGKPVPPWLQG
jgi:hypothetical protein